MPDYNFSPFLFSKETSGMHNEITRSPGTLVLALCFFSASDAMHRIRGSEPSRTESTVPCETRIVPYFLPRLITIFYFYKSRDRELTLIINT